MSQKDDNLSLVLKKVGELQLEQRKIPEPAANVDSVGICGTDVHFWTHGRIGDFVVKSPLILGHEGGGIVTNVAADVDRLKVGDRVAIEPGVCCRVCDLCKRGRYNLCAKMQFAGTPPDDGQLTRYYKTAADFCYKLPPHVTLEEAALLETLAVAVHACRRAGVTIGATVLICGAGPIGLVNLLTAKAMGAAAVCITDIDSNRLRKAKELGATWTFKIEKGVESEKLAEDIVATMDGAAPDITVECSGVESSIQTAIYATKSGGVLLLVGISAAQVSIPIVNAAVREVDIRGILSFANCYPVALSMVANGLVDLKPLITHRFSLEESIKAFETARDGSDNAIKVMIKCALPPAP